MPVIGFISVTQPGKEPHVEAAFRQGLSESGYVEGKNVAIEMRWVDDRYDLVAATLTDFVNRRVAVIVVGISPAAEAATPLATEIPVVFAVGGDPVQMGLVASMARPGGHLTGITGLNAALLPKKLELLHELVPAANSLAALMNPSLTNGEAQSKTLLDSARALGLQLHILHAANENDFGIVFAKLDQLRPGGLVIGGDPFFIGRYEQLAALAQRHAVPTVSQYREFAAAGGLMSYGGDLADDQMRPMGVYAGRILKGERAADLPVLQTTRVGLVINLKTAKAIGVSVPSSLLRRADEVIE